MSRRAWLLLLVLSAYMIFLIVGVSRVPFHPDEASLLYQSRDLELLLSDPGSLAWSPGDPLDAEQRYRALNPPLPKYVLGLGRLLAGYPSASVTVDWDWSQDWDSNLARGALPPDRLLNGARMASTILLPAALYLAYRVGRQLGGEAIGVLAAGLLGLNALFLLHGRRAMMEGALFFGLTLAFWAMLRAHRKPWLAGLAVGLALSAKHSLLPLLPLGLLASLWTTQPDARWRGRMLNLVQFAVLAVLVVLILNPFLWTNPLAGAAVIAEERGSLVGDQLQTQNLADHVAVELPMGASDRVAAFLGQLFFAPAQYWEAANYQVELSPEAAEYTRFPGHGLLRGWVTGGLMLGLTLLGGITAAVTLRQRSVEGRRMIALLLIGTLGMAAALLIAIPFPFQRYYLPMLPLNSLWAALAIGQLADQSKRLLVVLRAASS